MKTKLFKSGAWTIFDREPIGGLYSVKLYSASGELRDKVRCDTYRGALDYWRAFNAIAKQGAA